MGEARGQQAGRAHSASEIRGDNRDGGAGLNPTVAHPARVYSYWLGGKDHFPADREAALSVMRFRPEVVSSARANRAFLARVVRFLAEDCGIRQFIDIGTGLPVPAATHEVAQGVARDCRIVYVDNDPLVLVYARALLTSSPPGICDYIQADVRDVSTIVQEAGRALDLTQPVGVLLLAILHFLPDADDPAKIVAALADAVAPGSYLALSHLTADFAPDQVGPAAQAYCEMVPGGVTPRTHTQVTGLFGDLPLVPHGVVPITEWRPSVIDPLPTKADLYGGIVRKPERDREPPAARIG